MLPKKSMYIKNFGLIERNSIFEHQRNVKIRNNLSNDIICHNTIILLIFSQLSSIGLCLYCIKMRFSIVREKSWYRPLPGFKTLIQILYLTCGIFINYMCFVSQMLFNFFRKWRNHVQQTNTDLATDQMSKILRGFVIF